MNPNTPAPPVQPGQPQAPQQIPVKVEGELDSMGVDMPTLLDEYKLSRSYVELYTRDFKYLDDLVDGVPLNPGQDMPYVGDTTLAGLVRSIPRNSLQQLPVFSAMVNGTKNSFKAYMCTFFLKKYAFNQDTFGKGLLSTLQVGGEQALSHGYAPFMCASGMMYNDFGTTLRLLHYMDTSPEPGITDSNESGYHYVAANLTPSRVKKILKAAQANPNTTWNVPALQQVLESQPRAKSYSIYESAAKQNQPGEQAGPTYEFVTRYETGPDATLVTFCPEVTEAPLRVMDSKSRWGYPKVIYLVIDPAGLTPFGTSRVRLASPNQNLMNIYYGNIAAMLLLNSKPPVLKRGRFVKPVELKQGVVWETNDPNANATLVNMDNGALEQFVSFSQQFASQIQNILGGQTLSLNPGSKNSGFGKTAPGIKAGQNFMDVNTNQITKILENFLRQYALVALDTLLSEQIGEDDVIVDDDTKNAINNLAQSRFVAQPDPNDPSGQTMTQFVPPVGDDNKVHIKWDEFYNGKVVVDPNTGAQQREGAIEDWSVDIDVSLTPDELKDEKRSDLQDMLTVLAQNAENLGPDAQQKIQELTDILMQDAAPVLKPLAVAPVPSGGVAPPKVSLTAKMDPTATLAAEKAAGVPGQTPAQPATPAAPQQQ